MKLVLNLLLYVTQWLFIKMGGEVYVDDRNIILKSPANRYVCSHGNYTWKDMTGN